MDQKDVDRSAGEAQEVLVNTHERHRTQSSELPASSDTQGGEQVLEVVPAKAKAKRKPGRPKGSKPCKAVQRSRTHAKVLEYRALGVPVRDIAKAAGLGLTRTKQLIKQFEPTFNRLKDIEQYRDVRQELLTATELRLLESVNDPAKLADATLRDCAYSFDLLYKAGRLERGESTANTSVAVSVKAPRIGD